MNVTSNFLYPVIVAVSAITTTTPFMVKWLPFQSFRTKITSKWLKNSPLQHEHTSHQISNYLASCITHHYVTNSNTYYNYNRNYPAVLKIVLPLVESSKFGNAIAALITTLLFPHFMGTRFAVSR
jgi:CPA2 family monovalent cation:H+ antiporter-2